MKDHNVFRNKMFIKYKLYNFQFIHVQSKFMSYKIRHIFEQQ